MSKLVSAEVKRSGATSNYISFETNNVELEGRPGGLKIRFDIKSKGGGTTELYISIGPRDFPTIIRALADADRSTAMIEMSKELAKQIEDQKKFDVKVEKNAYKKITDISRDRFNSAKGDAEDIEYLVFQRVKKISQDLSSSI